VATFTRSDELAGAEFVGADLTGARFVETDLTGVVMRGVEVAKVDIDAPWLVHGERLLVNGVDVIPFVEAELDRRFPGRADRRAADPEGLRAAWATLERTWAATLDRVDAMPPGTVDVSVAVVARNRAVLNRRRLVRNRRRLTLLTRTASSPAARSRAQAGSSPRTFSSSISLCPSIRAFFMPSDARANASFPNGF